MFQAELVFDERLDRPIGIRDLRGCVRGSADATRRNICKPPDQRALGAC
jgi:hypothetical protein